MNKPNMIWIGRHEGMLRELARGVAAGDADSLCRAGSVMAQFIKPRSLVIPMPSHEGRATTMLKLCSYFDGDMGIKICDCLRCAPHESHHVQKLHGEYPCEVQMWCDMTEVPGEYRWDKVSPKEMPGQIIIVDNCIGTGSTAHAALTCVPCATVFSITKS